MNTHARVYRALLALYPRAFRREFAPDLLRTFLDLARDRGVMATWARCSIDIAVTVPRYHLEALVRRPVSSFALTALIVLVGLAGLAGLAVGSVAAVALLAVAAILAATQRTALARALVVPPDRRRARLQTAAGLALVCAAALASWVFHVSRYEHLGDTTVIVHNIVGVMSFVGAIGFGVAGLWTRTAMPGVTDARR